MNHIYVTAEELALSPELTRTASARSFEERLQSSLMEIGLAEPLKVAVTPEGGYTVIDGALRLRAIRAIREKDPGLFVTIPVYVLDYDRRFEFRFQSDIYQDLLPSQMAVLVEHLHASENILKSDIARYIGVSPATLRNYTGLWRLLERGGLFARIVELMDVGVLPASNPYAWLRLTSEGLAKVLRESFTAGLEPETWITNVTLAVRRGEYVRFPIKFVEGATDALPPEFYRVNAEVRLAKRDLGLRKRSGGDGSKRLADRARAMAQLERVATESSAPVLRSAASSIREYLA